MQTMRAISVDGCVLSRLTYRAIITALSVSCEMPRRPEDNKFM